MNKNASPHGRLALIDGLRGVAALAVLIFHFNERLHLKHFFGVVAKQGALGVPLFFVLSGFVISMSIGFQRIAPRFAGQFALRRAVRLDPPYLVSILCLVAIGLFGARFGAHQPVPKFSDVLVHVFYLQDLLHVPAISPVYWSLCLEIQFYLALLLGMWILQKADAFLDGIGTRIAPTVAVALILGSYGFRIFGIGTGTFIPMWFCFGLGSIAFWCARGRVKARYAFVSILAIIALGFRDSWAIMAAVSAGAILLASHFGRMHYLDAPLMQFFGRISYSLYLTHNIFGWYALSIALNFLSPFPSALIGFGVAIAVAWVWYLLIERPAVLLSKKIPVSRD